MGDPRVLKFGGAALADGPAVQRACRIVARAVSKGDPPPVVVVSAHRGVTDLLEVAAHAAAAGSDQAGPVRIRHRTLLAQLGLPSELLDLYWRGLQRLLAQIRQRRRLLPAELDLALSYGERLSTRIVARTPERQGLPATPVDAWDLGFVTDSKHGGARPLAGIDRAIRRAVAEVHGVAVVTGFVAKDLRGNLTTLGRNGSDLTASMIAEALGADEIQFWKGVDGILSADPDLVPEARVLDAVTYAEAAELAFHGSRVLHPAAVAPALRAGIRVRVRGVSRPEAPGTVLVEHLRRTGPVAIASRRELLRVDLAGEQGARRLLDTLEACCAPVVLMAGSGDRASAFVEPGPGLPAALGKLGAAARLVRDLASLALVGHGLGGESAGSIGSRALSLLEGAGVEVQQAFLRTRSESQTFVVAAADLGRATRTLHEGILVPARPAPR